MSSKTDSPIDEIISLLSGEPSEENAADALLLAKQIKENSPKEDQQPSGDVDVELLKKLWYNRNPVHETNSDTGEDMFWQTLLKIVKEFKGQPIKEDAPAQQLLETVKIALSYRDFGVLNEYLLSIGEKEIPAPQPKTDTPIGDDAENKVT